MTAEVAVLNRHAIALATDSAVTLTHEGGEKIFNSVNKLFALQKAAPVGVMIYGEADLMDIPWEPLLKVYRSQLKRQFFNSIAEYADNLLAFVQQHPLTNEPARQESAFARRAGQFYLALKNEIRRSMEIEFERGTATSTANLKTVSHAAVETTLRYYERLIAAYPTLPSMPKDVVTKRAKLVTAVTRAVFKELPITRGQKRRLFDVFERLFQTAYLPNSTGVVVAGYGEADMFPSLVSMRLDGVYDGHLRHTRETDGIDGKTSALLMPFAQEDVVATFMDGVHPLFNSSLEDAIAILMDRLPETVGSRMTLLDKRQSAQLKRALRTVGRETVSMFRRYTKRFKKGIHSPIVEVLSYMPKEELADLAESLVHLTSMRRRVALEAETVGGPIDVAIITKGDGFIWLKRKHYFRPELNPQFFAKMLQGG